MNPRKAAGQAVKQKAGQSAQVLPPFDFRSLELQSRCPALPQMKKTLHDVTRCRTMHFLGRAACNGLRSSGKQRALFGAEGAHRVTGDRRCVGFVPSASRLLPRSTIQYSPPGPRAAASSSCAAAACPPAHAACAAVHQSELRAAASCRALLQRSSACGSASGIPASAASMSASPGSHKRCGSAPPPSSASAAAAWPPTSASASGVRPSQSSTSAETLPRRPPAARLRRRRPLSLLPAAQCSRRALGAGLALARGGFSHLRVALDACSSATSSRRATYSCSCGM